MRRKLACAYARADTFQLARQPSYAVPTIVFPALFFLFFVAPHGSRGDANELLALYAGFAVVGVAFFQFGVGIAAERGSPWELYLRTLPASVGARFAARLVTALGFATAAIAVLVAAAVATTPIALAPVRWLALAGALLAGSIPFGLLGIALGYWATPRGALPLANVLYLVLSFGGGLWTGPERLPHGVARISAALPTRALADVLGAAVGAARWRAPPLLVLVGYGAVAAALAARGYRRDEGRRYA